MKYILDRDYRLRGWTDSLANAEQLSTRKLTKLTPHECLFLMQCDGIRDADTETFAPEIQKFLGLGMIHETEGDALLPGQEYEMYPNKLFREMYLSITGGCDFRCKHCFVAEDNAPRGVAPSTEELLSLIGRLDDCGIADIWVAGGEPLLHKGFMEVITEIARRRMKLGCLVTNLYHMTPEIADRILELGHDPLIHTSFDGLGYHEWLRGVPGSEKRTLENIGMMKKKGYTIQAHYCVWKDSLEAVRPTILKLRDVGVDGIRITCVEPAPRWVASYGNQTITPKEWLDYMLDLLDFWYSEKIDRDMGLDIWCFWNQQQGSRNVKIVPDMFKYRDMLHKIPMCSDAYQRPYIDCDGRIMLCIGMSGYTKLNGMEWGNVYTDDLHELLREGPFIDLCRKNLKEVKETQERCTDCKWKEYCGYGCRIEAYAQGNGFFGVDERVCAFFRDGYYSRCLELANRYGITLA